jgi:hypothetical protein
MTCTYMHSDELFRVRVIGTSYVPHCKSKEKRGIAASVYSRSIVGTIRLHLIISQPTRLSHC